VPGENGAYKDVNVFFGRVTYTHGVGLDPPLSVVRFDYADSVVNGPFVRWAPFSLVPRCNLRGEADNGSVSDGSLTKCTTVPDHRLGFFFSRLTRRQPALRLRGGGVERRRVSSMASTSLRTARWSAGGNSSTRRSRFRNPRGLGRGRRAFT
jgi:hypothetical protein